MGTIISPASIFNSTISSTANAREWWSAESRRCGSDWIGVAQVVSEIMHRLAATSSSWGSP
jgi:hypothetical protein